MTVICCNCKKFMCEKEGNGVSHGICDDCIKKLYPDLWEKRNGMKVIEKPQICSHGATGFSLPPFRWPATATLSST